MDSVTAYGVVAPEYYDRDLHPTCANFRSASRQFLVELMERAELEFGDPVELGAGDSVLAEVVAEYRPRLISNVEITDASPQMLSHSEKWSQFGARVRVADARCLPYSDRQFDLVVSLAGDPYNSSELWSEVYRVSRDKGRFVFTQPPFSWAASFREHSGSDADKSAFLLRDGRHLQIPSNVLPKEKIRSMAALVGFREVYSRTVLASEIPGPISPKLLVSGAEAHPVIEGFLFEK